MKKLLLSLVLLLFSVACQSVDDNIAGFDAYVWKRDKYGCAGERKQMVDTLVAQRDQILQLSESELIRLLGKPDVQELYERKQKFLIYLLEPNQRCNDIEAAPAKAKSLHIRLNAIGRANEVFIGAF